MRLLVVLTVFLLAANSAAAQAPTEDLQDRAVVWLQDYLRLDTVNPPGNEIVGARFLAAIFDAEGIPYEMVESAPGRGNIWARLKGGNEPGLLLLHHIDVVPADPNYWVTDRLSRVATAGVVGGASVAGTLRRHGRRPGAAGRRRRAAA